ncbi:hypothetical protein K7640_14285 [Micromonospora sp. PLK6-60]|uniref:hypothetical protein n=1 Tax=Micromonospora sp. PLK6-60 TaxID=2873383 RepID=UPI001CA622D6|nr:hypothetical protein [Micromonospora sp. PLK6-60]MBY8873001.1 hypothetical protein [Micromonospora sp. PLK6-60]
MAQRSSSGRGATATRTRRQPGNQTPNTPNVSESEISRMKADDIRGQLRRRGVSGISGLRKPELVKTLARTLRTERRSGGAARGATGPAGRAAGTRKAAGAAKRTSAARAKAAPAPTRAKAAPGRAKAAPSRAKAAPGRAKAAPSRAKAAPARAKAAPAKRTSAARTSTAGGTGTKATSVRTGRSTSRSVRSSQQITSLQDRPERPGRSLVTTNHEVIQRWARARNARPATIAGTERGDRAGVLTFNLPGYRESSRIREITWDEWFRTFDARRLNLIYQEQMRDGRPSNFFRTESPDRADA